MENPNRYVLGLDLSLTRAAAVLVPLDFRGDFSRVRIAIAGHGLHNVSTEAERDARCVEVAETVEELVHGVPIAGAFVENYAFVGARRAGSPHALGELRAIVRRTLLQRYGWAPVPVSADTARALFFGKAPRAPKGAKRDWLKSYILASVREAGAGALFKLDDEADAFLVANYGLTEVPGGVALTLAGSAPPAAVRGLPARQRSDDARATLPGRATRRKAVVPRRGARAA